MSFYKEFYKTDVPNEYICKETNKKFHVGVPYYSDFSQLFSGIYTSLPDAWRFFLYDDDHNDTVIGKVLLQGDTFEKHNKFYGSICTLVSIIDKKEISILESNTHTTFISSGLVHCDNGPARVSKIDGDYGYYINGVLHNEHGPALFTCYKNFYTDEIYTKTEYYYYGAKHNSKGPAVVYSDGDEEYYLYGVRHNENGPAINWSDQKTYYINGVLHNDHGPAEIWSDGEIKYAINGKLHNDNGPAHIRPNGDAEYFTHGKFIKKISADDMLAKQVAGINL